MKYWLSHLPLEVWVDCYRYPWISREELGRIVDRFSNYKFTEYLQFYLHDWGKRTMKPMYFHQPQKWVGRNKRVGYHLGIPQTEMPANIKCFEYFHIQHFDQQTINFLHQIHSLLQSDIKLNIDGYESRDSEDLRIILDQMVPLLDGIDYSLKCNVGALPVVQQCFDNEKMTKIKVLKAESHEKDEAMLGTTINFLMTWLNPAQQEGIAGPKWCEISLLYDTDFPEQICAEIREDFLAAKSPSTFALFVHPFCSQWEFVEFHLRNSIGEELHGVKLWFKKFQITRHKANCGTELKEWIKTNKAKRCNTSRQNQIVILSPTIGSIDAVDPPENVEEEQQASTSKKA